jgi:deoxycytidylate deaminase
MPVNTLMQMAETLAGLSGCSRLGVAALAVSPELVVLSSGFNAHPEGRCSGKPGACGCIHAEIRALDAAPTATFDLLCTHSPCVSCAERIARDGRVRQVYYREAYRLPDGLQVLRGSGVPTHRLARKC